MSTFVLIFLSLLLLTYPLVAYYTLQSFSSSFFGILLFIIVVFRFLIIKVKMDIHKFKMLLPLTLAYLVMAVWIFFANDPFVIRLNPVVINIVMLILFARTLFNPPSMIEIFARIQEPNLPDEAISYTKKVTIVWCFFFLFNGLIGLYTAIWSTFEVWVLYNGLIAYILIGTLFAVEFAVRTYLKAKHQ